MDKKHTRRKNLRQCQSHAAALVDCGHVLFYDWLRYPGRGIHQSHRPDLFLGVGIGLVTIVVYNPIAYNVFDIVRGGEIVNHRYRNKRAGSGLCRHWATWD